MNDAVGSAACIFGSCIITVGVAVLHCLHCCAPVGTVYLCYFGPSLCILQCLGMSYRGYVFVQLYVYMRLQAPN